jgi:hypothetical protein
MIIIHEQKKIKVNFYDGTWEGGWGIMNMQGVGVIVIHDKVG